LTPPGLKRTVSGWKLDWKYSSKCIWKGKDWQGLQKGNCGIDGD